MPQKLNKAGKMQDYIPAGNGDPSGEYGTSKGTNKNFTASDKKKTQANVITENKSVSVDSNWLHNKINETAKELAKTKDDNTIKKVYGTEEERDKKGAEKMGVSLEEYKKLKEEHKKQMEDIFDKETKKEFSNSRELREYYDEKYEEIRDKYAIEKDQNKRAEYERQMDKIQEERKEAYSKLKENGKEVIYDGKKEIKANIINDDLTGKKERAYDGSEYKSMTKEETQSIIDKLEKAGFVKDTSYSGGRTYKIYDKDTGNWNKISFSEDGKLFGTTINKGVYGYADLDTAIDRATYKSGKAPSDKAIGWETGAYDSKVYDAYSRKHTKYDD